MTGAAKVAGGQGDPCGKCGAAVPLNQRTCGVCNTDAGFPNVRMASRSTEREALKERVTKARTDAASREASTELAAFERAVSQSNAVMNRRFGSLSSWVNGDNPLFVNFYQQVDILGREPDGSGWDQQRGAAEAAISPFFYNDLNVAALSLDGRGMPYYGEYSVSLLTVTIEDRASVFEENPFIFNERHHVVAGRTPPPGYRAPWSEREILAAAKLQSQITAGMAADQFPSILMGPDRASEDCDFIEVHIFGAVSRQGIEKVVGPLPANKAEKALWRQTKRKLTQAGAEVEESS